MWTPRDARVSSIKDIKIKLNSNDKIYIIINSQNTKSATEILSYNIKENKIKLKKIIDKPSRIKNEKEKLSKMKNEYEAKEALKNQFLSDDLLNFTANTKNLNYAISHLSKTSGSLKSDLALILLGCLSSNLDEGGKFENFTNQYNNCVSKIKTGPPFRPVTRETLHRWKKVEEIRNRIYDINQTDKIIIPYLRSVAVSEFFEITGKLKRKGENSKLLEKLEVFIGQEAKKADAEFSVTHPIKLALENLEETHNVSQEAKKTLTSLCNPEVSSGFKKPERKVKAVNGVSVDLLNRNPSSRIDKFRNHIENLNDIKEQRIASDTALVLLVCIVRHTRWVSDGKITFDEYLRWYELCSSKLDKENPISEEVKASWRYYWKSLRKDIYIDCLTDAMLPVYFETGILAKLSKNVLKQKYDQDTATKVKKFINTQKLIILKKYPPNIVKYRMDILAQNPHISEKDFFKNLEDSLTKSDTDK